MTMLYIIIIFKFQELVWNNCGYSLIITYLQGIGCFTLKGNHGFNEHSHSTKSEYDAETNTLTVKGAHIIGWICFVLPKFPAVSMDQPRPFERRRVRQRVQHKDTSKSCDKTHSSMPSDEQTHCRLQSVSCMHYYVSCNKLLIFLSKPKCS